MGALCKLVDAILLLQFVFFSVALPLFDLQIVFPGTIYPETLVSWTNWYIDNSQDYLVVEKPPFFMALIWNELLLLWPLTLLNVYGMLTSKPWFKTTCLIYGASWVTSMAAIYGEVLGSKKAPDKLLMMYAPLMGFGVLALLRGLLTQSTAAKAPALARKKRIFRVMVGFLKASVWPLLRGAGFNFYHKTAILGDMLGSKKASDKLLIIIYAPSMGFSALALFRGLLTCKEAAPTAAKGPALARKKRA